MLVTKQWSEPGPVEFGKNIPVKASHTNFRYKIYTAKGKSVEGTINERVHTINADDELLRLIRLPMISFCANTNTELHVDFELI